MFTPLWLFGGVVFILALLLLTICTLFSVTFKLDIIMATQEQFAVILNRIDAATNDIAQDLLDLKDQIEGQGLPQDVEDSILASLDSAASRLEAVAAENPETPTEPEV